MLVGYTPGGLLASSTSWRNVYRLIIIPWDFPQSHTLTANLFLDRTALFLFPSSAPTDVTRVSLRETSQPCWGSSQRKYTRHYAVTRIHFSPVWYPCSTSLLSKWIILLRTTFSPNLQIRCIRICGSLQNAASSIYPSAVLLTVPYWRLR